MIRHVIAMGLVFSAAIFGASDAFAYHSKKTLAAMGEATSANLSLVNEARALLEGCHAAPLNAEAARALLPRLPELTGATAYSDRLKLELERYRSFEKPIAQVRVNLDGESAGARERKTAVLDENSAANSALGESNVLAVFAAVSLQASLDADDQPPLDIDRLAAQRFTMLRGRISRLSQDANFNLIIFAAERESYQAPQLTALRLSAERCVDMTYARRIEFQAADIRMKAQNVSLSNYAYLILSDLDLKRIAEVSGSPVVESLYRDVLGIASAMDKRENVARQSNP